MVTPWFCDGCGAELKPGPRRLCPTSGNGLHRVSQRQIDLQQKLAQLRLDALDRGRKALAA